MPVRILKGNCDRSFPLHSRLGPSSSHQWINCAGRNNHLTYHGLFDEDESEDAARGTVQHNLSAECLLNGRESWEFIGQNIKQGAFEFEVNEEMVANVDMAVNCVLATLKQYEHLGAVCYIETVVYSTRDPDAHGTADIRIEVPGHFIIILDFKFGIVRIDPDDSQLKEYGYMSYERRSDSMKGKDGEPTKVILGIIQPRLPVPKDRFRTFETTPRELTQWFESVVLPAMAASRKPEALLRMGDHCRFCPGNMKATCPAVYQAAKKVPINAPPHSLSNVQIGELLDLKKVFEKFFLGIGNEAFTRVRDLGQKVPGQKMVHKLGDRCFRDTVTVEEEGKEPESMNVVDAARKLVGDVAFTPSVLKSPAQIEKLPGGKSFVARNAYKPDTGLTLAPTDDPREEAVGLMDRLDKLETEFPI